MLCGLCVDSTQYCEQGLFKMISRVVCSLRLLDMNVSSADYTIVFLPAV